jgi:hypothetical protein
VGNLFQTFLNISQHAASLDEGLLVPLSNFCSGSRSTGSRLNGIADAHERNDLTTNTLAKNNREYIWKH